MEKLPVSVVIIAKNEEDNIAECVRSVAWSDDVLVVDDFSADRTAELAKAAAARVIQRKMDIEGRHRNYAYSQAKNTWVLSLDADERASADLETELRDLFRKGTAPHKAYSIPIKTYIGKRWIRYAGWYPAGKVRLFDKGAFKYEEAEVHPRVFIQGSCGHLTKDIVHYSYRDFHDYFASLNNQTTLEAKKWFKERRKIGLLKTYRKFVDRFLKAYFLKQGYKDGFLGLMVSYGTGLYQVMSYAKYWEMLQNQGPAASSQGPGK